MQFLDIKKDKNKIDYIKKDLKAIFFDMDGTIALATNLELDCFVKLFGKNKKYWKSFFGPSLIEVLQNAFPNFKKSKIKLYAHLWDNYYKKHLKLVDLIPKNTKITLKELKKKYLIGIITSTNRTPMILTLKETYSLFDFVLCADEYEKHKPNPQGLNIIMKKYKLKPKNIVYVGDNIKDIQFGKNAKVKTIGKIDVLFNKNELKKYNPDLIIKNISDLECLL